MAAFRPNKVIWYELQVDYLLNNPEGTTGRFIGRRAKGVEIAAKRQVGVRTGALRNSITRHGLRSMVGPMYVVGSRLPYALSHHEGTSPHPIYPSRKKVLRFTDGDVLVFTRKVDHPGTKPNRYLSDNLAIALL